MFPELGAAGLVKTRFGKVMQPLVKADGLFCAGIADAQPAPFQIRKIRSGDGGNVAVVLQRVMQRLQFLRGLRSMVVDNSAIAYLKLKKIQGRQLQLLHPGLTFRLWCDVSAGGLIELLYGGLLLLPQLLVEDFCVGLVQPDHRFLFLRRLSIHLTQATATGLQHHVAPAIALLRQDDAGQAAAVPAFLADLYQQDVTLAGRVRRR